MYTAHYSLTERPFDLSPSPRFLYLGENHREALALLTYGVLERKGFILLTGEVGTGKTTVVHALRARLEPGVKPVYLSNPLITPREFLDYLARKALGRETPFQSKAEFLIDFETALKEGLESRRNFLLIIDEAHKLSFDLLEEIRLLSNLETADKKLINIFLVGQPELRERLKDPRCKALFQRIAIHYHLRPLDERSVAEYVLTRLRVAGAKAPERIFPQSVIRAIHRHSRGYPRVINNLSDNLLLLGYVQGSKKITPEMVTECAAEMSLDTPPPEEHRQVWRGSETREPDSLRSLSAQGNRSVLVLVFLATTLILSVGLLRTDMSIRIEDTKPKPRQEGERFGQDSVPAGKRTTTGTRGYPQTGPSAAMEDEGSPEAIASGESGEIPGPIPAEDPSVHTERESGPQGPPPPRAQQEGIEPPSALGHEADQTSWKTVTVREGETFAQLAMKFTGRADEATLEMLRQMNPSIEDINLILAGQQITLPALLPEGQEADDRFTNYVPHQTLTDHGGEDTGDIFDRIDRDLLRTLREKHPASYRDFWEGLLRSDGGAGAPYGEGAGAARSVKKRVLHFVGSASEIEGAARSRPGEEARILHPGMLRAYDRLSSFEPLYFAPLLKDSTIYQETWQGDLTLIREIELFEPRSFSGPKAAILQARLHEAVRGVPEASPQGGITHDLVESAIASLHQLLVQEPSLFEAHHNLGVLNQTLGKAEEAEAEYRRALEQHPRNTKALLNLGLLHLQKGKLKQAQECFQRLNALDPQFAGAFYLLGVCKHRRKAYADAEDDFKRSIALLPNFLYPYIELGAVQNKLGREEEALGNFRVVMHHPNASLRELHKLAYCLLESGRPRPQEAIAVLDRILKKGDLDYELWNNRAVAFLRKGQLELARNDLNRAIQKDPARPEAFNNMGMAYLQANAFQDAATYFLHASRLDPSFRAALLNAAVVYGQYLGNAEKATIFAADYLDRGGSFQRDMLQKWLGSG